MSASKEIEEGLKFTPKFGSDGLITAISQNAKFCYDSWKYLTASSSLTQWHEGAIAIFAF